MIRWSAHLGTLFGEYPLLDRFSAAADAGFIGVDLWSPFEVSSDALVASVEESGVTVVAFNLPAGDMAAGERGFLNDPHRRREVRENAREAIALAQRLGCHQINALVGNALPGQATSEAIREAAVSTRELADSARPHGITILVEALNREQNPLYLLHSQTVAVDFVKLVGRANVGLLFDAYHVGMAGLRPEAEVDRVRDLIRHVHIADWPGRHEPGTGGIDVPAFTAALESAGFDGWIGLEYVPTGGTTESLKWLPVEERTDAGSGSKSKRRRI